MENALEKYYDQESGNFDIEKARIEGKNLYNFLQSGGKYEDFGKINSLNVSVATAISTYEILKQRNK